MLKDHSDLKPKKAKKLLDGTAEVLNSSGGGGELEPVKLVISTVLQVQLDGIAAEINKE